MFDKQALAITKPFVDHLARQVRQRGYTADQVTLAGFACGIIAAVLIASGMNSLALIPLAANRIADGLDGAVARMSGPSDRGAYLDITLDFLFYAAIPLAFALNDPGGNALAAAVLLASFIGTGTSFLAFAIIAEKRSIKSLTYPSKAFYYLGGLSEGTETIACFVLMCWWPHYFSALAYLYAAMCAITTATRLIASLNILTKP